MIKSYKNIYRQTDGRIEADKQTHRRTDSVRQIDRQADRQGQADRQTETKQFFAQDFIGKTS